MITLLVLFFILFGPSSCFIVEMIASGDDEGLKREQCRALAEALGRRCYYF